MGLLRRVAATFDDAPTYDAFYDGDPRRRASDEVAYGSGWTDPADPGASYALRWIADTNEVCAFREPAPDVVTAGDVWLAPGAAALTLGRSRVVRVLATATTQAVLDEALDGWPDHVNEPGSLQWALDRMEDMSRRTPGDDES